MAKDVTIRVTGQNADGTLNVQIPDGGNPFLFGGGQQQTQMVPYNPQAAPAAAPVTTGYRARINSVEVMFASEADYLKADKAMRETLELSNVPSLGGGGSGGGGMGSGGTLGFLRTGANSAEAVAALMNGRNIRRKLDDLQDTLDAQKVADGKLLQLESKYPDLMPVLREMFGLEREATEVSVSLLEDQLTAVDIQAGAGVAKVAADLWDGNTSRFSTERNSGSGNTLLMAGAGLGLGLLLTSNRDDRRRRR